MISYHVRGLSFKLLKFLEVLLSCAKFHYVKRACIRSYSDPHFPTFRLNNSEYEYFSRSETLYTKAIPPVISIV